MKQFSDPNLWPVTSDLGPIDHRKRTLTTQRLTHHHFSPRRTTHRVHSQQPVPEFLHLYDIPLSNCVCDLSVSVYHPPSQPPSHPAIHQLSQPPSQPPSQPANQPKPASHPPRSQPTTNLPVTNDPQLLCSLIDHWLCRLGKSHNTPHLYTSSVIMVAGLPSRISRPDISHITSVIDRYNEAKRQLSCLSCLTSNKLFSNEAA